MTRPRLSQPCPGRIRRWLRRGLFGATALSGLSATLLLAQEAGHGVTMRFDFGQQIEASTNPDLVDDPARDRIIGRTRLGFSLESETQVQRLSLGLGTDLEAGDFAGRATDSSRLANSRLQFGYSRASRNALVDLNASYSRNPVSDIEVLDEFTGNDLLISGGERGVGRIGFGIETGREAPIGLTLSGSMTEIRHFDVPQDEADDRDLSDLSAGLRLSLRPDLAAIFQAGVSETEYLDDSQYKSRSRYLGAGLQYELNPGLRLSAGLRRTNITTRQMVGPFEFRDEQRGFGGNLGVEMDRPNGTLSGSVSTDLYETGRRDMIGLSRAMELPRGALSFSAQLVDTDLSGRHLLFGGDWRHDLPRGAITLSAAQEMTSDEDTEALRSQLSVGYNGELTATSRWNAGLSIADYDVTGGSGTDTRRSSLTLGFAHDLTEDWALNAGYTHVLSQSDDRSDRSDDRIFVGVQSSFSFLP